jgi:hypothetical protein
VKPLKYTTTVPHEI